MKPFFTIIIPTLNEEQYIYSLLCDVKRQSFCNYEVIVVDGRSTDKTKQVVLGFKKSFRLMFHEVKKRNVSFQRNTGAQMSCGSYLVFLDADTRIRKNFLKNIHVQIIKSKGLLFIPEIFPNVRDPQMQILFDGINTVIRLSQSFGKPFSSGGSMIIERNFFLHIGGFSEKAFMSEDHQLVQEAYAHGVHAKFSPHIKVSFSLRRLKKEGKFKVLYKYVVNTVHFISKGKVDKKIFEYEMGGHIYRKGEKTPTQWEHVLTLPLKQIRTILLGLFKE